jgi:hypothetical protein
MNGKIVYISGQISDRNGYMNAFTKAHEWLSLQGYEVIDPAIMTATLPKDLPWEAYMEITLPLIKHCDAIYSLCGWQKSTGARIERQYASKLGLELMQQDRQELKRMFEGLREYEERH